MSSNDSDAESRGGNSSNDEPGAALMWFGKHKRTRLDKLNEYSRRSLLNLYLETPHPSVGHGRFESNPSTQISRLI